MGLVFSMPVQHYIDVYDSLLCHEEDTLRLVFRDIMYHLSVHDMSPNLFEHFMKSVVKFYVIRQTLFGARRPLFNYDYLHSKMEDGIHPQRFISKSEIREYPSDPHYKDYYPMPNIW